MSDSKITAAQALQKLMDGNKKFCSGNYDVHPDAETIKSLEGGQSPYAVIVSCADSRVPPNVVFNCSLGEIFVVRTAGNVVSDFELGSVEYAVEHLGSPLVMVLGHGSCGAVASAYSWTGGKGPLAAIMDEVAPSVARAKEKASDKGEIISLAELYNIENSIKRLMESEVLKNMPAGSIVGAKYNIHTGAVELV